MVNSKHFLIVVCASLALAATAGSPVPPKFSWTTSDPDLDHPRSKLYITIAGRKTRIATVDGVPQMMDKSAYKGLQIPAGAAGAVRSWWAGGGDQFFAVVSGNKVYIKQSVLEEQMDPTPWKTVATFSAATGRKV